MGKLKDLTGQTFGRLTVSHRVPQTGKTKNARWLCLCECGNTHEANSSSLLTGNVKSCKCLQLELSLARFTQHGGSRTPEYQTWQGMKRRCYRATDPKYPSYGGRGIVVCDRWLKSFADFRSDMGLRPSDQHSLDRIDVNGNYEPGNCRWALPETQSRNKRATPKIRLDGEITTLIDAAESADIAYRTVWKRRKNGDTGSALFRPTKKLHYIDGVGKTISEWAAHFGFEQDTIYSRINRGTPPEKWFAPLQRKAHNRRK